MTRNDLPFTLPEAVIRAVKQGRLTIFAGAGVSTETNLAFPTTLYEELKSILDWDSAESPTFPHVMSVFEQRFGRRELISEIAGRLDYVQSFPFITRAATRFQLELSTISHISKVITTNWDTAFEDYCQARPFVVDDDYAFYDLPGRKVFKIHGSIRSVSSIIATEEDYERRETEFETSAMGSSLKHFLATEVVVFIGFSLTDPDFQSVYRALLAGLARSRPPAYVVTPFASEAAKQFGLKVIQTDGTHFLHAIKHRLVSDDLLFPDSALSRVGALGHRARMSRRVIEESDWRDHAPLFFSFAYLDGIDDCTGRALAVAPSGENMEKNHLAHILRTYDQLLAKAIELERWWDAAYVDGYRIALYSFFMEDDHIEDIEMFQAFDSSDYPGVGSVEEEVDPSAKGDPRLPDLPDPDVVVRKFAESTTSARLSIQKEFETYLADMPLGVVPRHTPFLDELIGNDDPAPTL